MKNLINKANQVLMHTYNSIPVTFISGNGCYVRDSEGKEYLDFLAGIAVNSLGYNHPGFNKAVETQLKAIIHYSNLFYNRQQIELAEKLVKNSHFDKAFFCNSGTEAVESALKLAKKYGKIFNKGAWKIVAMKNSFHGRTTGSLSLTGQMKYQDSFLPLLPGISFADFNDFESLTGKIDSETCAVILEPIQGEGGIYPAEKEYLKKIRDLCTKKNIALIFDEVQCGTGRTGKLFAHEHYNVVPDIVCLAKGLGGGLPIGAVLSTEKFNIFKPGDHASTFGGNPLVCSGALSVLHELIDKNLLEHVVKVSRHLKKRLTVLQNNYPSVVSVRGIGLMMGIELNIDAGKIVSNCREKGLLLATAGGSVIRFVPPFIVTEKEIDTAIDIIDSVL